jgi:hypothetical protein
MLCTLDKSNGTFGGILVAAEHHKQKAAGTSTNVEQKETLLHVGITCHLSAY